MVQVRVGAVLGALLLCVVVNCQIAHARYYVVGGKAGWNKHADQWPKGKKFFEGDVLVFNYDPTKEGFAVVSESEYNECTVYEGNPNVHYSGHEEIKLSKGPNYFVSILKQDCINGLKMAVDAA